MLKPKKNNLSLKDKVKVGKAVVKTVFKVPTKESRQSVKELNSYKASINEEFPGAFKKKKGGATKDKNWIQKATASIKKRGTAGKCTPITKPGCTGKAKALAKTFKKIAKNR